MEPVPPPPPDAEAPCHRVDLSVVVPVYNEEDNLPGLYTRLSAVLDDLGVSHEIVLVNDGSADRSLEVMGELAAGDPAVRFIDLSRNFGHQIALTAGLDQARGEVIAIIDADLQDPPELIIDMYDRMVDGYEVVYAQRRARADEGFLKKTTAKAFYRLLGRLTSVPIPVDTGDFRLVHRRVVEVLREMPEQHKFVRGQIAWMGFRQTAVEYDRGGREHGETGYTYRKMIRLALDGITAFSDAPLRLATWSGFAVSAMAFLFILYALASRFLFDSYVRGWTSLMAGLMFIGGVQLLSIGIIGEYVGRIAGNVRDRPLYVVRQLSWDPSTAPTVPTPRPAEEPLAERSVAG